MSVFLKTGSLKLKDGELLKDIDLITGNSESIIKKSINMVVDKITADKANKSDVAAKDKDLQNQIDALVIATPSDAELIQARSDEDGVPYDTLKTRLDTADLDISALILDYGKFRWTLNRTLNDEGVAKEDPTKAITNYYPAFEGEVLRYRTLYNTASEKISCWVVQYDSDHTFISKTSLTNGYHGALDVRTRYIRFAFGYGGSSGKTMSMDDVAMFKVRILNFFERSIGINGEVTDSKLVDAVYASERVATSQSGHYTITAGKTYVNATGETDDSDTAAISGKIEIEETVNGLRISVDPSYTMRAYIWNDTVFEESFPIENDTAFEVSNKRVGIRFRRVDGGVMNEEDATRISESFRIFYASYVDAMFSDFADRTKEKYEQSQEAKLQDTVFGTPRPASTATGKYTIQVGKAYNNNTGVVTDSTIGAITSRMTLDPEKTYGLLIDCSKDYYVRAYAWQDDEFIESFPVQQGVVFDTKGASRVAFRFRLNTNAVLDNNDGTKISDSFSVKYASYIDVQLSELKNKETKDTSSPVTTGFKIIDVSEEFNKRFDNITMSWANVPQTSYMRMKSADIFALYDEVYNAHKEYITRTALMAYADADGTQRTCWEYTIAPPIKYKSGNPTPLQYDPNRLHVFMVCGVHGREKITPYTGYQFMKLLFDEKYPLTEMLSNCNFHIVPVVNQYGFDLWTNENDQSCWDNARANSWGININRQMVTDSFTEADMKLPEGRYPQFNWKFGGTDADGRPNPKNESEIPEGVLLKRYMWDNMRKYSNMVYIDLHMTVGSAVFMTSTKESDRLAAMDMISALAVPWKNKYNIDMYEVMNSNYYLVREPTAGATSYYVGNTYPNVKSAITIEVLGSKTLGKSPYSLTADLATQNITEIYHWVNIIIKRFR